VHSCWSHGHSLDPSAVSRARVDNSCDKGLLSAQGHTEVILVETSLSQSFTPCICRESQIKELEQSASSSKERIGQLEVERTALTAKVSCLLTEALGTTVQGKFHKHVFHW